LLGLGNRLVVHEVKRTRHRIAHIFYDMGIDHGCLHAGIPKIFLDLSEIGTVQQQVSCKRMAQGKNRSMLVHFCLFERSLQIPLD